MQTDRAIPDDWADVPRADELLRTDDSLATHGSLVTDESLITDDSVRPTSEFDVWTRPRRRKRQIGRRGLVGLVAGAVVLVLLVVAGFGATAAGRVRYAPSKQVAAFLDDLVAGRVAKALAAGHISAGDDPLLTAAAYRSATDRVTDYRIQSTDVSGTTATVQAVLKQGSTAVPATFTLRKSGSAWGVFSTWRLAPVSLGAIDVVVGGPAKTPVTVGGRSMPTTSRGVLTLQALPGSYPVAVDGGASFTAKASAATVHGFGQLASSPVELQTTLTAAGQKIASAAVDAWMAGCVASTDLRPSGCSFEAYGETAGYTYTNRKWTLDHAPVFSFGAWNGTGWVVTTTSTGSVTFTEDISGPAGSGTGTAGPISFSANGLITGISNGKATYRSLVSSSSVSTGS